MTIIQKRSRHRKSERSRKGNSVARLATDLRGPVYVSPVEWTRYSGDFLKYVVRHKNGVGRPPAVILSKLEWDYLDLHIAEGAF